MNPTGFRCDCPPSPGTDYAELRAELLELIRDYAGGTWTDHNTHDPGLTLGEHLCFGLTDLQYVAGLPMADLLTPAEKRPIPASPNFPAHRILPCRALTLRDYRKLLLDEEGVRNAWVQVVGAPPPEVYVNDDRGELTLTEPAHGCRLPLRGFYAVQVEFDDSMATADQPARLRELHTRLQAHRNLTEVFLSVEAVELEEVAVCVEISVSEDADLEEVAAQVFLALEEHLAPSVRFRSLEEELARGTPTEVLFEGLLLRHGFLDDAELDRAERPTEVRASDLVQVLMDVAGVVSVGRLIMTSYRDGVVAREGERWLLPLDPARAARLAIDRSRLLFFKRELPFLVSSATVRQRLAELRGVNGSQRHPPAVAKLPEPEGRRRQIDKFETLLNLLPLNYGVGPAGLPPEAPAERQAQARQLKAYFLLAELLLSGQRDQIARLPELLGLGFEQPVLSTEPPAHLRGFADVAGADEAGFAQRAREVIEPESERVRRRNAIVDHLLARLAEPYDPYVLLTAGRATAPDPAPLLADKLRLLRALPELAQDRAAAIDLTRDPGARDNLSGLEQKLHVLLGTAPALAGALEVYDEQDDDGRVEWRFRIREPGGKILLSSSRHYLTRDEAEDEIEAVARNGTLAERYRHESDRSGRFYFNLVDETGEIIARRIEFFDTEAERDAAIAACVDFLAGLPPKLEFYLLEHILLRPRSGSTRLLPLCHPSETEPMACPCDDPYSFRVTLVLPAWPARLRGIYFRAHFERLIRELLPAHLFAKICWVSEEQMRAFRLAWRAWRLELAAELAGRPNTLAPAQDALIDVWLELRSLFPPATLHDCVDGNDENPVVLDKTTLGTLTEHVPS